MENKSPYFTFGVTIEVFDGEPWEDVKNGKKFALTGRFPSPAYPDLQAVANAALDFLNGHTGTDFVLLNEPLESEEDDQQAERMAKETD